MRSAPPLYHCNGSAWVQSVGTSREPVPKPTINVYAADQARMQLENVRLERGGGDKLRLHLSFPFWVMQVARSLRLVRHIHPPVRSMLLSSDVCSCQHTQLLTSRLPSQLISLLDFNRVSDAHAGRRLIARSALPAAAVTAAVTAAPLAPLQRQQQQSHGTRISPHAEVHCTADTAHSMSCHAHSAKHMWPATWFAAQSQAPCSAGSHGGCGPGLHDGGTAGSPEGTGLRIHAIQPRSSIAC